MRNALHITRRDFVKGAAAMMATPMIGPGSARGAQDHATTRPGLKPQTAFLQEAILRGFSAIEARLDREKACRPYFYVHLQPKPRFEHQIWDLGDMCARYVDAFILGRQVTGCRDYHQDEQALRGLLHTGCDPFANPFMAGRMLLTFVDEYLQEPGADTLSRIHQLILLIKSKLTFEKDYAFYFKAPAGWTSMTKPVYGDFTPYPTYPLGGVVLALSRFVESVDSPESEDLLKRLSKFILDVSGTFDEMGRFKGHTHSGGILTAAVGILRWALRQHDTLTIQRMKNAFDWCCKYSSSWGWVPDDLGRNGASCETCSLVDAIHLGLLVARHVDPSYYGIVERFARNQLMENQFIKTDLMVPQSDDPLRKRIVKAVHGSWASYSLPNCLDNGLMGIEGCCLGAGIRGCYLVWENAITKDAEKVSVNMAFSRNSPWVEVISHQPYAGKIDIRVHDAPKLLVRIPEWVSNKDLRVLVNERPVEAVMGANRYIEFTGLQKGAFIRMEYPLSTREGPEQVSGQTYHVRWKGDTVIGILPKGKLYPLYEREWTTSLNTPLVDWPYDSQMGGPVHW